MFDVKLEDIITQPVRTGVFDAESSAVEIAHKFGHMLMHPPAGVYLENGLVPILSDELGPYHTYEPNSTVDSPPIPLTLSAIVAGGHTVYNKSNQIVLSPRIRANGSAWLTVEPKRNITAIKLVMSLCLDRLDSLRSPLKQRRRGFHYKNFIKDEYLDDVTADTFTEAISHLIDRIVNFIDYDVWHIYITEIIDSNLVIKKIVDYRVYDWHRQNDKPTALLQCDHDCYYPGEKESFDQQLNKPLDIDAFGRKQDIIDV